MRTSLSETKGRRLQREGRSGRMDGGRETTTERLRRRKMRGTQMERVFDEEGKEGSVWMMMDEEYGRGNGQCG